MRPKRHLFISCLLLSGILFNCSSEDDGPDCSLNGTIISVSQIAGSWNATRGAFFSTSSGPAFNVDVVADGGSVTLTIQTDGRFSVTVSPVGEVPTTSNGSMCFDEDLLVIIFDSDPDEFEFFGITLNEPIMTLGGGNGSAEFDFDGDGVDEPANIDWVLERI